MTQPSTTTGGDSADREPAGPGADPLIDRYAVALQVSPEGGFTVSGSGRTRSDSPMAAAVVLTLAVVGSAIAAVAVAWIGMLVGLVAWLCAAAGVGVGAAVFVVYLRRTDPRKNAVRPQAELRVPDRAVLVAEETGIPEGRPLRLGTAKRRSRVNRSRRSKRR
ncbi:MAG: hypothetical protein HOV94_19020 [Saccharothrix sp.]|nr:hypothetical protein [Saccharothrix sp.]